MKSPDNRRIALHYYEAFRDLAEDCWAPFLSGCEGRWLQTYSIQVFKSPLREMH